MLFSIIVTLPVISANDSVDLIGNDNQTIIEDNDDLNISNNIHVN